MRISFLEKTAPPYNLLRRLTVLCAPGMLEKPENGASPWLWAIFAVARQKKGRATAKKAKIKRQILKRISIFADGKFEDGGVKYNKWTAWLVQSGRVASRCSGAGRSKRADTVDRGSCVWRVLTI